MRALARLRSLIKDQKGNALVIAAATLPLVVGAAAIGVDTAQSTLARRQLQRAADSAALAGVYALVQSRSATTAATHDLTLNNDMTLSSAPVIENAPTTGGWAGSPRAVRVVLTAERTVPFMAFFTGDTMSVTTEATAAWVWTGDFCAVATETGNVTGILIPGSSVVNLGCGMISNSSGSNAFVATGSSTITATPIAAVGAIPPSANYAAGTTLQPYSLPFEDPFGDLPNPTVPANCQTSAYLVEPNGVTPPAPIASSPGVYCYRGMTLKGPVTLPSGTYIVDGGLLEISSQANATCNGCTFVLTSRNAVSDPSSIAQVSINGSATLNLSAPDTGLYTGLLLYQDRRAPYGQSFIRGSSTSTFRGAFYLPNRELVFAGAAGMTTQCVQMVARRLQITGSSSISNNCPPGSGSQGFEHKVVRLVG